MGLDTPKDYSPRVIRVTKGSNKSWAMHFSSSKVKTISKNQQKLTKMTIISIL